MTQRTDRIDALLREEIGAILARDVSDPAIGFTTVTDVETVPDLSHALVWVSIIGQPPERAASLAALRRALPFIRHLLGKRVRLRRIPELHLRVDETLERGTRVLRLLAELEAGEIPDGTLPTTEPLPTPLPRLPRDGDASDPGETPERVIGAAPRESGRRRGRGAGVRRAEGRRR